MEHAYLTMYVQTRRAVEEMKEETMLVTVLRAIQHMRESAMT